MKRSQFCKASWMFFGAALAWSGWVLLLTSSAVGSADNFNAFNACAILSISGTLSTMGIVSGLIGIYRSHLGQSSGTTAIAANVMLLISLLLFR